MSEKPSKTSTRSLRLLLIASSLGTAVFMMVPVDASEKEQKRRHVFSALRRRYCQHLARAFCGHQITKCAARR